MAAPDVQRIVLEDAGPCRTGVFVNDQDLEIAILANGEGAAIGPCSPQDFRELARRLVLAADAAERRIGRAH